jgi:hypothetical protein
MKERVRVVADGFKDGDCVSAAGQAQESSSSSSPCKCIIDRPLFSWRRGHLPVARRTYAARVHLHVRLPCPCLFRCGDILAGAVRVLAPGGAVYVCCCKSTAVCAPHLGNCSMCTCVFTFGLLCTFVRVPPRFGKDSVSTVVLCTCVM